MRKGPLAIAQCLLPWAPRPSLTQRPPIFPSAASGFPSLLSCLREAPSPFSPPPCLLSLNSSHLNAFPALCPTIPKSLPDSTAQVHAPWHFSTTSSYPCPSPGGSTFGIEAAVLLPPRSACPPWQPPLLQASARAFLLLSTHVLPAAAVALTLAQISKSCREVAFIKYCPRSVSEEMFRKKRGKEQSPCRSPLQPWRFSGRIFEGLFSFLS